ncbi:hypothetical protein ACFT9M_13815 [Micromonospora purpureochromogenes]
MPLRYIAHQAYVALTATRQGGAEARRQAELLDEEAPADDPGGEG